MSTEIRSCLNGIYPRSEALIRATRDLDRGRTTGQAVDQQFDQDQQALLALQREARLDLVSDGMLRWPDLFRPLVEAAEGLEVGPLTRYFDNNSFFKQPLITGRPRLDRELGREFFPLTKAPESVPWKAVLPSPYFFSRVCQDGVFSDPDAAMMALAEGVLRPVVEALDRSGCAFIQFNEPHLAHAPRSAPDLSPFRSAMRGLVQGLRAETGLHLYFADAGPMLDAVTELDVGVVGIDFVATDAESLPPRPLGKALLCGCVDGRNSLVEGRDQVVAFVEQVVKRLAPPVLYVTTNCELELLPEPVAREKAKLVGAAGRALHG